MTEPESSGSSGQHQDPGRRGRAARDGTREDRPIFHLTEEPLWEQALRDGASTQSTRGALLSEVGYIHCSFAHQVEKVADYVYRDWDGDLLLLQVDPAAVPSEIRIENLDGGSDPFPHIYGPLPVEAVQAVHRLTRPAAGTWLLPPTL